MAIQERYGINCEEDEAKDNTILCPTACVRKSPSSIEQSPWNSEWPREIPSLLIC